MTKLFYHTRSLLFSIPLSLLAIGVVFMGPRGWFFSLLLLFASLYLSGTWTAIKIDQKQKKLKRIKGFLWFSSGEWEQLSQYDKIYVGPEIHLASSGSLKKEDREPTSFNIYLINKAGIRYTLEKMQELRPAIKNGAYYARIMGLQYDMWKWPKRVNAKK
ncbi:MAG: hypothetical protein ACI9J3_002527 [Parvicellaceae bacterium]|jgi:hypothetical protein